MSIKWIQKNNFLKEFIIAYDEELSSLADSTKLIYIDDVSKNSNDYYEKIKRTADSILDVIASVSALKYIILDNESQLFVDFKQCCDNSLLLDCNSLFNIYDKNNIEICKIKMPSVLPLCHQRLHEDLIEIQVIDIIDGEIIGLKNKYNNKDLLLLLNKTKNHINNYYKQIGVDDFVEVRHINVHNIIEHKMLNSVQDYFNGCLKSFIFKGNKKIPLLTSLQESPQDYGKRFFDFNLIDVDINTYLNNFSQILEFCKEHIELGVYPNFDVINKNDLIPYIELQINDEDFYELSFNIIVKENLNINNFLQELIYINDIKSENFTIGDFFLNRDEMFDYLKTIDY